MDAVRSEDREEQPVPWYYAEQAHQFLEDAGTKRKIGDLLFRAHIERWGEEPEPGEIRSWDEESAALAELLEEARLEEDQMVLLEYCLGTRGRIDALLCGLDGQERPHGVLLECKRWKDCTLSACRRPGRLGLRYEGTLQNRQHPSVQVLQYEKKLVEEIREREGMEEELRLDSYVYFHNCFRLPEHWRHVLLAKKFSAALQEAPIFFRGSRGDLRTRVMGKLLRGRGEEVLRKMGMKS